jgi:hypothetical protein
MKTFRIGAQSAKAVAQWGMVLSALVICLVVLTWGNYRFSQANPGGNDFLARWMGARFFLKGIQPYDERVALESQLWIYGRAADPGRGEDLSRFAYPLYAMVFFAPFGLFEFTTARALWMTMLELGTIAFAVLAAAIGGWESQRGKTILWIFFSLLGYFGFRAVINGNPIVLVGLFLASAIFLFGKGYPWPAGILLALTTIKPQIAIFPVLWFILWCIFQKRYSLFISLSLTLAALTGVCMLWIPNWIVLNLREILDYPAYTQPGNPSAVFGLWFGETGRTAGWIFSLALLAGLGGLWIRNRKGSYRNFLIVMGITISVSPLLGIPYDPGNEYLLLLPIALGLSVWKDISRKNFVSWALTLGGIFFGLWAIFLLTLNAGPQPVQNPILLFPLPFFLLAWFALLHFGKNRSLLSEYPSELPSTPAAR